MRSALLAGALLLAGCAGEEACTHDPPLTYHSYGKRFMDQYCAGCHSSLYPGEHPNRNEAPGVVNFDSYSGVVEYAERSYIRTLESPQLPMPPGGGPTESELERFEEWMRCEVFPDAGVEEW